MSLHHLSVSQRNRRIAHMVNEIVPSSTRNDNNEFTIHNQMEALPILESDEDNIVVAESHISSCEDLSCANVTETGTNSNLNLTQNLCTWAQNFAISQKAVTSLLTVLHPYHKELPHDARTLLRSPRNIFVSHLASGYLNYFGIEPPIIKLLEKKCIPVECDHLNLEVNFDGLSFFKSSNDCFWPILGHILESREKLIFIIGVFYGKSKPSDVHEYLKEFINESKKLAQNGILFNGKRYRFKVTRLTMDAPAREFIKCTKSHVGYSSCDRCCEEGEWRGRVVYLANDIAEKRSDLSFREQIDENHHKGISPICQLTLDLISDVCLDYMHLICLGVMKKLLIHWMRGPLNTRLSSQVIAEISNRLLKLIPYVPSEFARRPRPLCDIDRWKATEFRQFLLYSGPLVLKGLLPRKLYDNFLLLHVAMSVLCSKEHCKCNEMITYANSLLQTFVTNCKLLYGEEFMVYNIHMCKHLADDVYHFKAPLDEYSCFPYENFMKRIKRVLKVSPKPFHQLIKRVHESDQFLGTLKTYNDNIELHTITKLSQEHFNGPNCLLHGQQYSKCKYLNSILSLSSRDNCIKIDGNLVIIRNFIKSTEGVTIIGQKFKTITPFYMFPCNSTLMSIYLASDLSDLLPFYINKMHHKYFIMPHFNLPDQFFALPIIHTEVM